MASTEVKNIDHRAPDVRHLVYSMYRKMLTEYNDQANEIINAFPREMVQEDADIYTHLEEVLKQKSSAVEVPESVQTLPPPPPSLPGAIAGRRLKSELPERNVEPPAVIQNAMLTKDKKPFTYTPGGINLSEIRSPRMQRRITRNACAGEMSAIPAPTINQNVPCDHPVNTNFSAMQSQLPSQVLPPIEAIASSPVSVPSPPPPPPPPPPAMMSLSAIGCTAEPQQTITSCQAKQNASKQPLGFDPNEILTRVNKPSAYKSSSANHREDIPSDSKSQQPENKSVLESKQLLKPKEDHRMHVPAQNEPGRIYQPVTISKAQKRSEEIAGSVNVPKMAVMGQGLSIENKPQAPWATVHRTPQSSVPWANRESSPSKGGSTRIIPIQIEGKESLSATTPLAPSTVLQQQQPQHQQTNERNPFAQQQPVNTRIIPIQIEGSSVQYPASVGGVHLSKQHSPVTVTQSQTPLSPNQPKEERLHWPSHQPRSYNRDRHCSDPAKEQSQDQAEFSAYNTAGVPVNQLRKMHLSDDDRALMDKFKTQVDDEVYLHRESDPRYRGAVIPSRAFRMLQSMTDNAGNVQMQVSKSPARTPTDRPSLGAPHYQEVPPGSYVPPSEQHVEEPRKYIGGSIPSRSFRMLQAMTGQDISAPNSTSSLSGRETPVSGLIQRCPSSSPSPMEPLWGYLPAGPNHIYSRISDINSASGPSPIFPSFPCQTRHFRTPFYNQPHQNHSSDDEQGYSSTDELAHYYANGQKNLRCSSLRSTLSGSFGSSPMPFKVPLTFASPIYENECLPKRRNDPTERKTKRSVLKDVKPEEDKRRFIERNETFKGDSDDEESVSDSDSDGDSETDPETDADDEDKGKCNSSCTGVVLNRQTPLTKPVSSSSGVYPFEIFNPNTNDDSPMDGKAKEKNNENNDASPSGDSKDLDSKKLLPHQLSVIYEESEYSDKESFRRQRRNADASSVTGDSEASSPVDGKGGNEGSSDNPAMETSVTVILPFKSRLRSTSNNGNVTPVTVGHGSPGSDPSSNKNTEKNGSVEGHLDDVDISVSFIFSSRSNSVVSIDNVFVESVESDVSEKAGETGLENNLKRTGIRESDVNAELTMRLPFRRRSGDKEKNNCNDFEADRRECVRSETDGHKNGMGENSGAEPKVKQEETRTNFDMSENELDVRNGRDWNDERGTDEAKARTGPMAAVEESEEVSSPLLRSPESKAVASAEWSTSRAKQMNLIFQSQNAKGKARDLQEESEDDSGVTSDVSIKQTYCENDAGSEMGDLCKMVEYQRASTHSRLFKLLQEECERCGREDDAGQETKEKRNAKGVNLCETETLSLRKKKLSLPLNVGVGDVESQSSSSGIASPSSPTVSDALVNEFIFRLLNKKKKRNFNQVSLEKLKAAAIKILQEEIEAYDSSPTSGDDPYSPDSLYSGRSTVTVPNASPRLIDTGAAYGCNCHDYFSYRDTWPTFDCSEHFGAVPSNTFEILGNRTSCPKFFPPFKPRCPRVVYDQNNRIKLVNEKHEYQSDSASISPARNQERVIDRKKVL